MTQLLEIEWAYGNGWDYSRKSSRRTVHQQKLSVDQIENEFIDMVFLSVASPVGLYVTERSRENVIHGVVESLSAVLWPD
jgi:hypothetical protein